MIRPETTFYPSFPAAPTSRCNSINALVHGSTYNAIFRRASSLVERHVRQLGVAAVMRAGQVEAVLTLAGYLELDRALLGCSSVKPWLSPWACLRLSSAGQ